MAAPGALTRLESVLRQTASGSERPSSPWALVGALAVSARAEPRFTRDIDVAIAVTSDADAEGLVRDLQARRYRVPAIVEQEATRRLATARSVPDGEDEESIVVDALFVSSGIEAEVVSAADHLEMLPGLSIR